MYTEMSRALETVVTHDGPHIVRTAGSAHDVAVSFLNHGILSDDPAT
jgi:hypothetical protein